MNPIVRVLRRSIMVMVVAVGLLGLAMKFLDLPGGPWTALRALPDRVVALVTDTGNELLASESPLPHQPSGAFQTIQQAIGCAPLEEGADPGPALTEEPTSEKAAWSWRDDGGVAHFADAPPLDPAARDSFVRQGWETFHVQVTADDAILPGHFDAQLNAAAVTMYAQWQTWLGHQTQVQSPINLRFMGNEDAFMARWGHDDTPWKPLGFYRIRTNEAVILYTPRQQRAALATAFHEMSHLITAWQLGPSPAWLNEGIAEHFETMDLTRNRPRFWINRRHMAVLRGEGVVPLRELTALSRRDWAEEQAEKRYASAWALVTFLLASDKGRETLGVVMDAAYEQRCARVPDLDSSLGTYPGGIDGLEGELLRWVQGTWVLGA